jgi:hypothetical protein
MLDIQVDASQLGHLAIDLQATGPQFDRALRSTIGKMVKWVKTRSLRVMAKEANVPQKILRRRIRVAKAKTTAAGTEMAIWYGQNPVGLIYLKPKKTSTGITATGRKVNGAFIATMKSGHTEVFKRRGKARLPIDEQSTSVKEHMDEVLNREFIAAASFEAQFFKVLEHEIEWQTRH